MEIWKDVEGYEGYYKVSNKGNIKSLKRKVPHRNTKMTVYEKKIKSFLGSCGYPEAKLCKGKSQKTHRIHQLVLEAFVEKFESDEVLICNHIDGNKENNEVENLEWVTYGENNKHAYDIGLKQKAHIPKKDLKKLYIDKRNTLQDIADIYGYCTVTVSKLLKKNGIKTRPNGR